MVICPYFVNNMCRFGQKCNNEHINVRLILKTDAEAVLKGNQWILSGYSPFRDKPNIQNFTEDQSFEEIRLAAYEAKNTGTIQNVTQQLAQSINDAKQKMNMLMNPSNDILNSVINLYNGTNTPSTGSNPFSLTNTQQNNANLFGGSNSSSSAFGSTQANPFASNAGGFGASNQTASNLFGGSGSTANTNSVFGGGTSSNTGSVFGGSSAFGNATQQSIFGGTTNTNTNAGPFSQGATLSGPFSQTSSVFGAGGGAAQSNPVFGGPPSFGSKPSGLFGQSNTALTRQPGTTSIFGQNAQPFGQSNNTQSSIFGGANQNQNQSIFGQQQQQPQTQGNIFGGVNTAPSTNVFGNPNVNAASMSDSITANVFGSVQHPQQQQAGSIFGGTPFQQQQMSAFGNNNATSNNVFGTPSVQTSIAPNLQQQQQSIFGGAVINTNKPIQSESAFTGNTFSNQPFGGSQFQQQPQYQQQQVSTFQQAQQPPISQPSAINTSAYYSAISDLNEQDIESFKAKEFVLGKIPTKPPPKELCV